MLPKKANPTQLTFCTTLEEQLSQRNPIYILANKIDWSIFENEFRKYYSEDMGRPAKPIRLLVGLIILKHIRNLSDESVVEQWQENSYYQYFCGMTSFVIGQPCEPSEPARCAFWRVGPLPK